MYRFLLFVFLCSTSYSVGQNNEAFQIYNQKGKKISVKKFLKSIEPIDILLFGEFHDNPIAHWLELKTAQHLRSVGNLTLGAEMFETDQQQVLNAYIAGDLTQEGMDSMLLLWPNYKTDYKPLVDYAKKNDLSFIATNIPRKHASFVYRNGLKALEKELNEEDKPFVAPLPILYDAELPGYKAMLEMMGHTPNPNFPKAQAIKDATMAHFILKQHALDNHPFLHFNGAYHSNNYEGIYWYLKKTAPNLKVTTVSTVQQKNVRQLDAESRGVADFIIVVDQDMTKTH